MANPTGIGGFRPGQTGNPRGRPKENPIAKELARAHTEQAVQTLAEIMRAEESGAKARAFAATALLDRGWGRPSQSIEVDGQIGVYGLADVLAGLADTSSSNNPPVES